MKVDYVQHWGDDLIVANAARVSFDKHSDWEQVPTKLLNGIEWDETTTQKLSDKDEKLVHYLAKAGHTSCFEHMGATLKLKVPIFIARQIQRHRTFSYNEVSRRYVDSEPEFFYPSKWRKRAADKKQGSSEEEVKEMLFTNNMESWTQEVGNFYACHVEACEQLYNSMLKADIAPEQARMVLPQSMYTEFYMTGNLRAWEHFLKLRLDGHAQVEVQDVAKMVEEILQPLFPVSMKALMEN